MQFPFAFLLTCIYVPASLWVPEKTVLYTTKLYITQKRECSFCKVNKTTNKYRILYLKNVKLKTYQKQLRNAVAKFVYKMC